MTPEEIEAFGTAISRAQAHLATVSDDLSIAHLAGDLQRCRAAVAAAISTVGSVTGDLAAIAALIPEPVSIEDDEEVAFTTVTPLAT